MLRLVLCISALIAFALANSTYPDPFDGVSPDVCVDPLNFGRKFFQFMNHFNMLILGDINVTTSLRTSGPLAVNGQLTVAKSIVINTNQNSVPCGGSAVADDLGLYVRNFAGAGDTMVSGRVMIQGNTNTGKIYQLEASCTTQPFKDLYSDMTFLSMMTSIIAVARNTEFRSLANNPTAGLDPCRAIFNIVPMDQMLFPDYTASKTVFKRAGTGLFGGTILSVWSTLADGSSQGQYAGQVVALTYDSGNIDSRVGDFSDAGGICQGDTKCWVPTNLTLPKVLGTTTVVKVETTTLRTKTTTSTSISSRAIATSIITVTSTLTSFVTSTSYSIPQVTIAVPATTTATLEFVYEKHITATQREPTTLGTSITVPGTSLTTTTSTTVIPTTTTMDTTTDTYFTYRLNETTTTSTTYVSTSISNTYDLTTISTKI
ncbi:hypothetical protein V8B55DRAFT_1393696 [Mucor lusitanicus]|uniref:Uncharacterized protein n=1 Tax=Mucor circinelloides f. lusitanicus TaxID=29924 RepID=A0A8H4BDG7_MUCCL|nr:hypothetical protein FB192DRAFT_1460539 [Mucor lusitanicus]